MKMINVLTVFALVMLGNQAFANTIKCNRQQTRCTTVNKDLTIGDKVGLINRHDQLVAIGFVKTMRGKSRSIKIKKTHGKIQRSDRLVLLGKTPFNHELRPDYKVFQKPADLAIGGHFGISAVGIGDGAAASEFSGFGTMRKWRNIQLTGRATYMAIEGELTRMTDYAGQETLPISINGFGLLGGAGYTLREYGLISFRGELDLGLMYVSANIDGDSGLVSGSGFDSNVENGFGKYLRGSIGALYNIKTWHIEFAAAVGMVHDAPTQTIYAGVIKDLR